MQMSVEQWWNGTDRGEQTDWKRKLPLCHFVQHKYHMEWPGIEPNKSVPTSHSRHRAAATYTNQLKL